MTFSPSKMSLKRVGLAVIIISLIIVYAILWRQTLSDRAQITGTDYIAFYAAARIARDRSPMMVYNLDAQRQVESQVLGFEITPGEVNIFVNPPFIVPLVVLSLRPTFSASLLAWQLIMLIFLLAGVGTLYFLLRDQVQLLALFIFLAGVLFFLPAFQGVLIGQDSAILFLGACLWLVGILRKWDWLAGLGLALMTIRPHLVLPLALPFLFKRRKVFAWFLAGAGSLALFSLAYSGMDGIRAFLNMLSVSAAGLNVTIKEKSMVNLLALLLNKLPFVPAGILRLVAWAVYFFNLAGLCFLWWRTPNLQGKYLSLALLLATFTAPHLHFHDLLLWSLPLAVVLISLNEHPALLERLIPLPWLLSMVFLLFFIPTLVRPWIPILVLIFLLALLHKPEKLLSLSFTHTGGTG